MGHLLTKDEAAQQLGISTASITNWIRHGYLTDRNNMFDYNEILSIKKRIDTGEIDRLNKRANKSSSNLKFIPDEYVASKKSISQITEIIAFIHDNNILIEQALFLLAINMFIQTGDIFDDSIDTLFQFKEDNFKRKGVYNHITDWLKSVSSGRVNYNNEKVKTLLALPLPKERDILGIIYQSILNEGRKSNLGSYYTPKYVVESLIYDNLSFDSKALDPCCGTGQFLLSFCDYINNPNNIYGFDIDDVAINIAKTNLLLYFFETDFTPNIFHQNTLLLNLTDNLFDDQFKFYNKFDFIATNPPWGAKYDKDTLSLIKQNFPEIKSKESFSFFICQSYRLLKRNGTMSFVLPESITNVKTHQDIRAFILANLEIKRIQILGKCFKKVLSSVISIQMKKERLNNNTITITDNSQTYLINQNRFVKNKNNVFDIYVNEIDSMIFNKIEARDYFTLENNADWALGIVTGDNKKFLQSSRLSDDYEPIYKGSDILPFKLKKASNFISFDPKTFQQVAPIEKYRTPEKLLYKFISSNLVFAYDCNKSLSLNSANILIPNVKDYSIKIILGLLNSKLFNYYYKKKFNSIKILRGHIEQLPFPILTNEEKDIIVRLVDEILYSNKSVKDLDNYIFDLYSIDPDLREYICAL